MLRALILQIRERNFQEKNLEIPSFQEYTPWLMIISYVDIINFIYTQRTF